MKVLLFRGRGAMSMAIRWQSRSIYSHAAIQLRDGSIIESWQGSGVQRKILTDWKDIDAFDVVDCPERRWELDEEGCEAFLVNQIGKGYDYKSVLRFISRRKGGEPDRWFCSELVYAAIRYAGVDLFLRCEPWRVSPGMLLYSPLLEKARRYPVKPVL
jgi:uncharacterized protein YycO